MNEQIAAFKPGTKPSLALAAGYFSADMFIKAVQASLKTSKTLTSASVQKAASKMTYQIKNTVGPTTYPASYKYAVKSCVTLEYDADGTAFTIVQPFYCTTQDVSDPAEVRERLIGDLEVVQARPRVGRAWTAVSGRARTA